VARYPDHLDVFWADYFRLIGTNYWPAPAPQGLAAYWRDMSYGQASWGGTQVFGWRTIPQNLASFNQLNRPQKIAACMAAFPEVNFGSFFSVIATVNSTSESGSAGGKTILDPPAWILTLAAHETGHDYGLDHSFDDSQTSCDPGDDSRPGAYKDPWEIMSARCFAGQNPMFTGAFGQSGPGLNAPYRDKLGWIPSNRNNTIVAGNGFHGIMTLAALNHPEANGYLMIKFVMNANDPSQYYTLEFRRKEAWDQAIPEDTVLIHLVKNGLSYLITADGGPQRVPGQGFVDPPRNLFINVQSIDTASSTATVDVTLN